MLAGLLVTDETGEAFYWEERPDASVPITWYRLAGIDWAADVERNPCIELGSD